MVRTNGMSSRAAGQDLAGAWWRRRNGRGRRITSGPFAGISRNAHLYVKTPAAPWRMLTTAGSMSMARCTDICGREERSV